ncbi:MAG: Cache 3/Cache 2 fusion domain-containing protein [Candidatus Dependentiae bacterium]|nr:Cache 3/Cache 2 fusion domain-containing protein [Candidatus Dependentiae bacterium]
MVTEAQFHKEHHGIIKKSIMIVGSIGLCFFLFFTFNFLKIRYQRNQTAYSQAQQKNKVIADYLSGTIDELSTLVHTLKETIEKNGIDHTTINTYLKTKPVSVTGLGLIITDPWYAPYYVEEEDKQIMQELPQTVMQEQWYHQAIVTDKEFSGLFFDEKTNQPIFYTATPVREQQNQKLIGIAFATLSMAHIRHILSTLYTDSSGYRFLLDQNGTILTHPESTWVRTKKNIADLAKQITEPSLVTMAEKAQKTGSSFTTYHNEMTGDTSWLFLNKIPATNWILAGVVDKRELPFSGDFLRHHLLLIITSFIFVLLCLLLSLPPLYKHPHHIVLWIISGAASLLFLLGIVSAWILSMQFPRVDKHDLIIENKSGLYTLLQQFDTVYHPTSKNPSEKKDSDLNRFLTYRYKNKNYVPTGIIINDMQFVGHDQLEFVGFIWQRYFDGVHDGVDRGFILPQATHKTTITEISRTKREKAEIVIWQVQAQINQNLHYKAFPFDIKNIKIQVTHKDFEKNILLVPDLDAYKIINPATLPGIGQDTELVGWYLLKSYFDYEIEHYLTNFGLYSYGPFGVYDEVSLEQMPELRLNIVAQRHLLDTILTDLLALCVIAVILFVLLLTYFSEKKFEYILETCAAAFFSSVFAQIQFRSKIASHEFVYFEIFYFTLYLAILLILVTTLIHMFKMNVPFIRYDRNIVTKLLYWPFILGTVWAVTMAYLY